MPYAPPPPAQTPPPQYEVIPQEPALRWNFWLSDGPAAVYSTNSSLGNRFRIGAEAQCLHDHRLILGVTMIDLLTSGESSPEVGGISRYGFDLRVGYFLVPDSIFVEYGLYLGDVSASDIVGWKATVGHSIDLGWRVYSQDQFNLALELSYLYMGSQNVPTFVPATGEFGEATYPGANVYSVSLRIGFDLG